MFGVLDLVNEFGVSIVYEAIIDMKIENWKLKTVMLHKPPLAYNNWHGSPYVSKVSSNKFRAINKRLNILIFYLSCTHSNTLETNMK